MTWTKVKKEDTESSGRGHFKIGWFYDWFSGIMSLWRKTSKTEGDWTKIER